MKLIKKWLIKFIHDDLYSMEEIEKAKLQKWLLMSYKDYGFKHYYTMRKKYIINLLALGLEGKEMHEAVGRLKELEALKENIKAEFKRVEAENERAIVREKKSW